MLSITNPTTPIDTFGLNIKPENTPSSALHDKKKKKKKKRSREDEQDGNDAGDVKERKKKRKHQNIDPELLVQEASSASVNVADPECDASVMKKKKKDKGKAKEPPLAEQTDAEIEANSQASAAALLSAIVAASVTNTEVPQMPAPPQYDPRLMPPGHQFMPYPPMQYGYSLPPSTFDPNGSQPPSVFSAPSMPGGNAFSELAFGSNEDVLRALQDLDMSKIANVLKTLGEAAAAANVSNFTPQLGFIPTQLDQLPPLDSRQAAVASNSMMGIAPKQTISAAGHKRTIDMNLPGNERHTNPDHAHLLANKWLNASKLAELVRDEGLVYRKGKFSAIEDQQLRAAIEQYQHEKQLTDDQLLETIFSKSDKSRDTVFWSDLTAAVPLRPIIAVYHHVRRSYHPMKQQGAWKPEEDEALKQAVTDLGQQWEKVTYRVGRMASDCRDRYRNHIVNRDIRVTGHWSKEEEEKLIQIVTDMTIKQGKDFDNDVFWGKVSELMGGKRGRQQCRIKWTDALSKTVKNEGLRPRWGQQDAFILVHKVDSLNVRDDTEIDWKLISDPDWNLWSAHTLQRRWLTLKKSIKGYEDMTHQEIMDILRIKKAHLPAPPAPSSRKRKERKVTSAPAVNEPDSRDGNAASPAPEAGPSTVSGNASLDNGTKDQASEDDGSTDSDS